MVKDSVFVSPAPGIIYANVYEGEEYGIDRAQVEKMGSVAALEGMAAVYPGDPQARHPGAARRRLRLPEQPHRAERP